MSTRKERVAADARPPVWVGHISLTFDLTVEDLDATHRRLGGLGMSPSEISEGHIHRSFTVADPNGQVITFNSSHVSDQPV